MSRTRKPVFTLIELIAALAIAALLLGLVIGRVGQLPAFASLHSSAGEIKKLFVCASSRAVASGRESRVLYDREQRVMSVSDSAGGRDSDFARSKLHYRIPEGIELEYPDRARSREEDDAAVYRFFPDGSASGPDTVIRLRRSSVTLKISPLTGGIHIESNDDEN